MSIELILAPLQGFTDAVFRNIYARHFSGLDSAVAPFISTMDQKRLKPSRIRDILPENNKNLTITPQILSNRAEDFIFLANHISDLGHDTINWNLGCPHTKITRKKKGSGLLPFPREIDAFLDTVCQKIKCRVSVKVRLGKRDKTEIFNLLPVFNQYPLKEIIVHPRTGLQMYKGCADLSAFLEIKKKTDHSLVYNGDITSIETIRTILSKSPDTEKFMIGRGILADPFLPGRIKNVQINTSESHWKIKNFHDDLFNAYDTIFSGPAHVIGRMKGFWSFLGPSFKGSPKVLKKVFKSKTKQEYIRQTEHFFSLELPFSPSE